MKNEIRLPRTGRKVSMGALALGAITLAALSLGRPAGAAVTVNITYTDAAGTGFNDTTSYTKAPYSAAKPTTLGAARKRVFEACAHNWAQRFDGNAPITITASFKSLTAPAGYVTLGSASPTSIYELTGGPYSNTWYVAALTAALTKQDPDPTTPMIQAQFNSDLDKGLYTISWYYGTDGVPPANTVDFYHTCLHEFGHGLGFFSLAEKVSSGGTVTPTGDWTQFQTGPTTYVRWPSIFDQFLANGPTAAATLLTTMTKTARKAAFTSNSLYFSGQNARLVNNGVNGKLFAPTTFQSGSSIAHADEDTYTGTSTASSVNELMTPDAGPGTAHHPGPLVTGIFFDMEWPFLQYTVADVKTALKLAAGLQSATDDNISKYRTVQYNIFPAKLTFADALMLARKVGGTELNP